MPAVAEELNLAELNAVFETSDPEKIVSWAVTQFGDGLVMSSSFGAESALLLHMATRLKPDIKVVMIDTGYLFPETYEFMEKLRHRFNLNVWMYRTRQDPIAYLHRAGERNPFERENVEACCNINKNEPFERAFKELQPKAWLRGTRRDQAETRKGLKHIEWARRYGTFAVSPILNWRSKEIYQYMKKHDLPYHPLYEKGYASIGCNPITCTTAIQIGEDARSGRWKGKAKVECGINLTDSQDSAQL
jgi:phosphoadenosine phosphosulfate reductase